MSTSDLEQVVYYLSKLPGLGSRSARRAILHLMKNRESLMLPLAKSLEQAAHSIKDCEICRNLDVASPCNICTNPKRDPSTICVVEEVADLWAIERSKHYNGLYHILGGNLSAIDGRGPEELCIDLLADRAAGDQVEEIILAMNATVEGQTTAHYITERLKPLNKKISRLAHGIPIGGELDYLDDGTLSMALKERMPF